MNEVLMMYEAYLVHYGVKGMKWGVRRYQNKDGSLTPEGQKKYAKALTKEIKRSKNFVQTKKHIAGTDEMNSLYNKADIQSAKKKIKDLEKVQDDFYSNEKLLKKYHKILAKETSEKYGIDYDEALFGYERDDLDQGDSFDRYLKDTGRYEKYHSDMTKAHNEYHSACKKAVESYIGQHGKDIMTSKEPILKSNMGTFYLESKFSVQDFLTSTLESKYWDDYWSDDKK